MSAYAGPPLLQSIQRATAANAACASGARRISSTSSSLRSWRISCSSRSSSFTTSRITLRVAVADRQAENAFDVEGAPREQAADVRHHAGMVADQQPQHGAGADGAWTRMVSVAWVTPLRASDLPLPPPWQGGGRGRSIMSRLAAPGGTIG